MKKNASKITDLLALTVFAAFAVCLLIVLLFGAQLYQNLVQRGEESFRQRTATQYLRTRVQQAEHISLSDFQGCEALAIREEIDGISYVTRVYFYEGFLRELFSAESAALAPGDGEKIMPAESLDFQIDDDLLTAVVDGQEVVLQLRGKVGELP